jgi:ribose/xylose/arabinose/galactoside ABC-type transport system permease subunit
MNEHKKLSLLHRIITLPGASVFLALIVFVAIVSIVSPMVTGGTFLTWTNIINIFRQQTYIGIMACALTLVIITGNMDLSIGSQLTMLTILCARWSHAIGDMAILLTLIVGIICGLINGLIVKGFQINSFVATIGTGSIYGALTLLFATGQDVRSSSPVIDFLGTGNVSGMIPMSVVVLLVVVVTFAFLLQRTVFGQRLYAIGANPTAARFSGIRSSLEVIVAYTLTGLGCAIAAVLLIARSVSANPQIGAGKEMDVVLAVVLGGTSLLGGEGSVWGTAIGFLFIGFMSSGFTALALSTYLRWIVTGFIMLIALTIDVYKYRK